jgi:hypothetical protein
MEMPIIGNVHYETFNGYHVVTKIWGTAVQYEHLIFPISENNWFTIQMLHQPLQ